MAVFEGEHSVGSHAHGGGGALHSYADDHREDFTYDHASTTDTAWYGNSVCVCLRAICMHIIAYLHTDTCILTHYAHAHTQAVKSSK